MNLLQKNKITQKYFEKLVGAYISDLYRYAYWLSCDENIAEDVVQESLLRAWRSINKLKDLKLIKSRLLAMVRNEYDRNYKNKNVNFIGFTQVDSMDENIFNNTDVDVLRCALNKLDYKYREPIILNVMMRLSVDEVACQMELSIETVNVRLFRAREKLLNTFTKTTNFPLEIKQQSKQQNSLAM